MHASPLVTVEIAVHEGSMTEDTKYSGLSHLSHDPEYQIYMKKVPYRFIPGVL